MLKVYANYGAMFPIEELAVTSIVAGVATAANYEGETRSFNIDEIRNDRPASGSPIGIYWNEKDAY